MNLVKILAVSSWQITFCPFGSQCSSVVEQLFRKQQVVSSILTIGSIFNRWCGNDLGGTVVTVFT